MYSFFYLFCMLLHEEEYLTYCISVESENNYCLSMSFLFYYDLSVTAFLLPNSHHLGSTKAQP